MIGAVEPRQTGAAPGVNTILRTIGGALGAQLAAVVLTNSAMPPAMLPADSGYVTAFLASAGVVALAFLAALTIPSPSARHQPPALPVAAQAATERAIRPARR